MRQVRQANVAVYQANKAKLDPILSALPPTVPTTTTQAR